MTTVKYYDSDNVEQTLSSGRYTVDITSQPARVVIDADGWPEVFDRANAVTVRFVCGYGATADDVPASLRAAMLLHIGDLFENRQNGQAQQVF